MVPWTTSDVDRHIKGLSPNQKKGWVEIANSVLKDGGSEGKAIRIANSKSKKVGRKTDKTKSKKRS